MTSVNNNSANLMVDTELVMTSIDALIFDDPPVEEDEDAVVDTAFVGAITMTKIDADTVCLDSGVSSNLFNDVKWFDEVTELQQSIKMTCVSGGVSQLSYGGKITL